MNWDLIIGAGSVALPIAVALWKWGTTITKFMASTEQRISQLEKAEDTVCNRLEAMEQRQTERHEGITKAITTLREELIATNSIKPKS
jgi:hypothetical protein